MAYTDEDRKWCLAWDSHDYSWGVTIGDGAVIEAGSIVTKDVGLYEIWAGNPARFIQKRFDDEIIEILLKSQW